MLVTQLCLILVTPWTLARRLLCPWKSPGKNTGVSSHSLLQGIFPTQGWNLGLLHCRQILYCLSYQRSPCPRLFQFVFLFNYLFFYIYIFFFFIFYFLLKCSWLTVFQVHSKVIQLYKYTYIIFEIIFHHRALHDIDYGSLCYAVNLCCISIF